MPAGGRHLAEPPAIEERGPPQVQRGCRPKLSLDAASHDSDPDEERCNRRSLVRRSWALRSRASPAQRPGELAGSARGLKIRICRIKWHHFSSTSEACEADSGKMSGRPPLRASGCFDPPIDTLRDAVVKPSPILLPSPRSTAAGAWSNRHTTSSQSRPSIASATPTSKLTTSENSHGVHVGLGAPPQDAAQQRASGP